MNRVQCELVVEVLAGRRQSRRLLLRRVAELPSSLPFPRDSNDSIRALDVCQIRHKEVSAV
jgi:hypothetical protein